MLPELIRFLIAEDDPVARKLLATMIEQTGAEPVLAHDGAEAWERLQGSDTPTLLLADWMMPELSGVELCRRIRSRGQWRVQPYIILVTSKQEVVEGLESGANDFLCKPVDLAELRARVKVGVNHLILERRLADRVDELEHALREIHTLQGFIPVCSYCRRVRDDREAWHQMEAYVSQHTGVRFSHGICPSCVEAHFPDEEGGTAAF